MNIAEDDKKCCLELEKVGIHVNSVYDLVNTRDDYPNAVPVLLRLLKQADTPNIKEGVIRALAVKSAKGIAEQVLIEKFLSLPDVGYSSVLKWTIGNTLYELGTIDTHFDAIAEIVMDPSHGTGRRMLVMLLGKTKKHKERSAQIAYTALGDKDIQGHAIRTLGNLRSTQATEAIEGFLSSSNSSHRKEAQGALKKIQKSLSK